MIIVFCVHDTNVARLDDDVAFKLEICVLINYIHTYVCTNISKINEQDLMMFKFLLYIYHSDFVNICHYLYTLVWN